MSLVAFSFNAQAQIPQTGLVEHFTFDSLATGQKGTVLSVDTIRYTTDKWGNTSRACMVGNSYNMTENTQIPGISVGNADRSVAFWFKRNADGTHTLFSQSELHNSFTVVIDSSILKVVKGDTTISSIPLTFDSAWHHVVVIHKSDTTTLYYDTVAQTPGTFTYTNDDDSIRIGRSPFGGAFPDFCIDELLIYNRALTVAEVAAIYAYVPPAGITKNKLAGTVVLYPNPTADVLNIKNIPPAATIKILDMTGRVVYNATTSTQQASINTTNFANGLLILQLIHNGETSYAKFEVRK